MLLRQKEMDIFLWFSFDYFPGQLSLARGWLKVQAASQTVWIQIYSILN